MTESEEKINYVEFKPTIAQKYQQIKLDTDKFLLHPPTIT